MRTVLRVWILLGVLVLFSTPIASAGEERGTQGIPTPSDAPSTGAISDEIEVIDKAGDLPARTVYIELNKVKNAARYDIEVRPYEQNWANPYRFTMNDEKIRVRLTPGHYAIRTRSIDQQKRPGNWGEWGDFWVKFKPPVNVYPAQGTVIEPKANVDEKITFEWPENPLARYYLFKLKDAQGRLIRKVQTPQTWLSVAVEVNAGYTWSVMPRGSRSEPEPDDSEMLYHDFSVAAPNVDLRSLYFEIGHIHKAEFYEFEFVKFLAGNETGEPSVFESREPNYRVRLGPGEYEMRVRSVYAGGNKSDWSPPERFYVEFPPAHTISPRKGEVVEATDDEKSAVTLKWNTMREAGRYIVLVQKKSGEQMLVQETSESRLDVELPAEEDYQWQVLPLGPREPDRRPASVPSDGGSRFSIEPYVRLGLSPSEEPSQLYAWGRYLTSNITYLSKSYDNNNIVSKSVFGGTGELAAGYWHRKTNIGLLGAGALSGFNVGNLNYTYSSGSLLMGYRMSYEGGHRLRLWAGPAYRETPEIQVTSLDTAVQFNKVSNYGPEFRLSYLGSLNDRYGWHVYGSAYYGLEGLKTPNGLEQNPELSYNVGLFGTYEYSKDVTAMAGYSYQVDAANYRSTDRTGSFNRMELSGHYLSLTLVVGLAPAYK